MTLNKQCEEVIAEEAGETFKLIEAFGLLDKCKSRPVMDLLLDAAAELSALRAQLAAARAAAEPFVAMAADWDEVENDEYRVPVKVGAIRKLAAAFNPTTEP